MLRQANTQRTLHKALQMDVEAQSETCVGEAMRKRKELPPIPCKCGCGVLIPQIRIDLRGTFSKKKYATEECKRKARSARPKAKRRASNIHHVGQTVKDKMIIHPLLDEYLTGRLRMKQRYSIARMVG